VSDLVKRVLFASCLAVALGGLACADDPAPPPKAAAPDEVRETLPNGLEVVILPSAKAKTCAVVSGWRTGARDEQTNEAGAAQLVARLVRRSACGAREADAADKELAALAPKSANGASTGCDSFHELTYTWATVPEEKLGVALDIERDRLVALKPTAALLDDVRQSLLTVPMKRETRAWDAVIGLAYPESSLGRSRLGSPDTVAGLGLDAVEAWRKAHLRIDTQILVIAGCKDAKAALQLVHDRFEKIAKPEAPLAAPPGVKPAAKGPVRATIEGPQMARHVWLAFRGPEPGTDDEAAFITATFALKDKVVAALQGKAHDATVRADTRSNAPALLVISATPRPATNLIDIEARARGAANLVRTEAPADLEKLKARVEHAKTLLAEERLVIVTIEPAGK
jgi:predicted Zn-dependent peptidase